MLKSSYALAAAAVMGAFSWAEQALAAEGRSAPWQIGLQEAHSPVMERVHDFHTMLLVIQIAIVLLVLAVLGYVIFRFNRKRNPVASKTSHNTAIEVVWTALPIVILVIIAIPSIKLLYYADKSHDPEMTLKITGHQWYWSYSYPDQGDFEYDSIIVPDDELEEGQLRLLTVDNPVVLPVNTDIQLLITSDDVIHDWAVPSLGLKTDAIPGRINESWVRIDQEGTYYGMCSELCGVNHGFMPIQIKAVSKEAFAGWVKKAKEEFANSARPDVNVATAPAQGTSQSEQTE